MSRRINQQQDNTRSFLGFEGTTKDSVIKQVHAKHEHSKVSNIERVLNNIYFEYFMVIAIIIKEIEKNNVTLDESDVNHKLLEMQYEMFANATLGLLNPKDTSGNKRVSRDDILAASEIVFNSGLRPHTPVNSLPALESIPGANPGQVMMDRVLKEKDRNYYFPRSDDYPV